MKFELDSTHAWLPLGGAAIIAVFTLGTYSTFASIADAPVNLTGNEQVPPVKTAGAGIGTIVVALDRSVRGNVTTTGIAGTAAHIHEAAGGRNGPAILSLTKKGDTYVVPAGSKLTEAQLASFMAGDLYINVHTAANPDGEIRGQVMPR